MEGIKRERKSNIELLRVLSMIMIVFYHFFVHGEFEITSLSTNAVIMEILSLGGRIGYDCFIIISGYFLIKSEFKINKLLRFIFQVTFYSIGLYLIFLISGKIKFGIKTFANALLPIIYMNYSFATEYVILLFISPYLNKFIYSVERKQLQNLIIILFTCWSIIPTIFNGDMGFSSVGLFVYLYLIGAYIRIYEVKWMRSFKINVSGLFVMIGCLILSVIIFNVAGIKIPTLFSKATHFSEATYVPVVLSSIFLFLIFKNIDMKYSKAINVISSATFGVLLIHDNEYVRNFLWIEVFKNSSMIKSKYFIIYEILVVLSVYIVCTIIEIIRSRLIEQPLFNIALKNTKINNFLNRVNKKLFSKQLVGINTKL